VNGSASVLEKAQSNGDQSASPVADSAVQPCALPIHWIEIQLIGEDGKGVADQPYVIVSPDGVEHFGRTDARGLGRVNGIPGGSCKISFTELDIDAWESV
jgi:hypothetical protein